MQRHVVRNVEEAVELALRFKKEGRYDWFRGQLQSNWLPGSSMERAIKRGESEATFEKRILRFVNWASTEPSVSYLSDPANRDQLFAVLQHYGVPTCYIDFSTEPAVAGFFACDSKEPPSPGTLSAIFCLDTSDLRDFYDKYITPSFQEPLEVDLVSVNVDNLWRLQAQAGHFVFANHDWYRIYDLDRIEFPWTGNPSFPPRNRIYPEHSSALEHLLNNYFEGEKRADGYEKFVQEQAQRASAGQPVFKQLFIQSSEYDKDIFKTPPEILQSWSKEALKPWLETHAEIFHDVVGVRHIITLRNGAGAPLPDAQLLYGIAAAMRDDNSLRMRAVQWELQGLPEALDREPFEKRLRELWNGMRRLPYTDEDIAAACGALLQLCGQPGCRSIDGGKMLRAFQSWQPDAMEVEFGSNGDTGSRGYCSGDHLRQAISQEWKQIVPPETLIDDPRDALRLCRVPQRMLDFAAFSTIFGREIIPSQLAQGRPLIHFNPARLDAFGLA